MSEDRIIRDQHGEEHILRERGRTDQTFHDAAEVLGCDTDLIMAVHSKGRNRMALYTPGYPEDRTIWAAYLRTKSDGTLRLIRRERADMRWDDIEAQIEADLREKFGEPGGADDN